MRAHARREIDDVYRHPDGHSRGGSKRISELYAIEEDIRGLPASQRLAATVPLTVADIPA